MIRLMVALLYALGTAAIGGLSFAATDAEAQVQRRCSSLGSQAIAEGRVRGRRDAHLEVRIYCGNELMRRCRTIVVDPPWAATCRTAPVNLRRDRRLLRRAGGPTSGRVWTVRCRPGPR